MITLCVVQNDAWELSEEERRDFHTNINFLPAAEDMRRASEVYYIFLLYQGNKHGAQDGPIVSALM
jgi:arginyl-tRNA--protein-N-Asp/Glu arginylyltransferase